MGASMGAPVKLLEVYRTSIDNVGESHTHGTKGRRHPRASHAEIAPNAVNRRAVLTGVPHPVAPPPASHLATTGRGDRLPLTQA